MGSNAGPNTVVQSNILHYDIANTRSYVGTGRTINNIIQASFGATTVNNPTFSSAFKGLLNFSSASLQYGIFPDFGRTLTDFTIEVWYTITASPANNTVQALVTQFFNNATPPNNRINFSLGFNGDEATFGQNRKINGGFYDGTWNLTTGFDPSFSDVWYQSVVTYNGTGTSTIIQYTNGSQVFSKTITNPSISSSASRNFLMRRWDDLQTVDGKLASVRIYDKALSAKEVMQNYNAIRERYGL